MKTYYLPSAVALSFFLLAFMDYTTADNLSEIERDAKALEIYLQDKSDHKEYCPNISWKQPSLEIYKEKLTSQLPEDCKE
jgi:hypothetical protein